MAAILFVCTANQCRSPVAAALARTLATTGDSERWQIDSAGTWAEAGRPVHPQMVRAAQAAGVALPPHRARSIEHVPGLERYDLIVTMERNQQEALHLEFPQLRQRVHLLAALAGPAYDIPDPVGGPPQGYRQTIEELRRLLQSAWPRIQALVTAEAPLTSS